MDNDKDSDSLAEWADELEKFLECEEHSDKISQEQKEALLDSVAKHMLENLEEDEGVDEHQPENKSYTSSHLKYFLHFVLLCLITLVLIKYGFCQGKSFKLCWNNNIQDWIYPILRTIRLIALPVIQYFPSITDLHEETCLLENPLYRDLEVDCRLCRDVSVVTLPHADQFEELFYHRGVPVVVQDAVSSPVSLSALSRLYVQHRDDIVSGSSQRLRPAPPELADLDQLLGTPEELLKAMPYCIQWRLLRVSAVRHLRRLFERPYFISKKTEVSLHRYIYICGDQGERFSLPMTEFANVWVSQHSGTRKFQLAPSSECSDICRPVSALLRPGETLFYNWRYWRASALPVDAALLAGTDAPSGDCLGPDGPQTELGGCRAAERAPFLPATNQRRRRGDVSPAPAQTTDSVVNPDPDPDPDPDPNLDLNLNSEVDMCEVNGWETTHAAETEEEGADEGRGPSGGTPRSAHWEPSVGITFVGSFY